MGMPGSESALDELMTCIQEGKVERVADDLYIGADDILSLFKTWEIIFLSRLQQARLRLSAPKTVMLPMSTTLLGWEWSQGKL